MSVKVSSRFIVILLSLSVSAYTMMNTLYILSRFKILDEPKLIELHENDIIGHYFALSQDLSADSLRTSESIDLNQILTQEFLAGEGLLKFDAEAIRMQADTYGSTAEDEFPYEFKLNKRINQLEVPHGISNLKTIRTRSTSGDSDKVLPSNPELNVRSELSLEISGNLGLDVHSKRTTLKSSNSIHLESKDNSIKIEALDGLRLPKISPESFERPSGHDVFGSSPYLSPLNDAHNLCINSHDGRIYQTESKNC